MAKETFDAARSWPLYDPLDEDDEDGYPQELEGDGIEWDDVEQKGKKRGKKDISDTIGDS